MHLDVVLLVASSISFFPLFQRGLQPRYDPTLSGELKPLQAAQMEELPWEGGGMPSGFDH